MMAILSDCIITCKNIAANKPLLGTNQGQIYAALQIAPEHGVMCKDEMELTAANGHVETELHSAAWRGEIGWAMELISNGANVNKTNSIGEIPLHGAAACGNTKMVKLLLKHGSNYALISSDG